MNPLPYSRFSSGGLGAFCVWHKASATHRVASNEGGGELVVVYPCCKDNDVMNEERERVGEREREISRLMPGGMSDKPVYV